MNAELYDGCGCLKTIQQKLEAHHKGEVDLKLDRYATNLHDPNATEIQHVIDLPPLHYSYKDGKKWHRAHVQFTHCPFCGQKKP